MYLQHVHHGWQPDEPSTVIADRCSRSRINSAIFVSSEGRGFDSIEFLRRHGSQSVLCRKARSAENITDEDRKVGFTHFQLQFIRNTKVHLFQYRNVVRKRFSFFGYFRSSFSIGPKMLIESPNLDFVFVFSTELCGPS